MLLQHFLYVFNVVLIFFRTFAAKYRYLYVREISLSSSSLYYINITFEHIYG